VHQHTVSVGHWLKRGGVVRKLSHFSVPATGLGAGRIVLAMACILTLLIGGVASVRADSAQYYYDPAGRLTTMVDPVNGSAQYNYDAVGNILSVVRRPITDLFVAQVSPSRGRAGDVVTISGTGFGTTADTTVSFNGQSATPTAVSATQITVPVPSGAPSGVVSVTSPVGTASSNASFIVTPINPVSISGISPSPANQGATITISGSGFDTTPASNKVLINGRYAAVSTATSSALTALVPAVSSGRVTVSTKDGTASSSGYLAVPPLPFLASSIGSVVNSAIGNSATLSIASVGKIGLILFDATAGQQMTMTVTASSFGSATLTLYGPDGSAVTPINPISTGTVIGRQFLTLTGTYAVLLAPASGQTGSATVSLNTVPPDVTATIAANATPVSLTTTVPGQNMRLTFNGTAGQRIDLLAQFSGLGGCASFGVTILQPDGVTRLFSNTGCGNGPLFTGLLPLPVGGTYTIMVSLVGAAVGTGTFTLYTVPPDLTATIAANGTPVSLTTTVPGQNMSLTFTGTAGQRISLLTQGSASLNSCGIVLQILQPDGTTKLYSDGCFTTSPRFSDVLILPVAGTYTIQYSPAGTTTGTATFTLNTVPPDITGTIAVGGGAVSLTTTVAGQNMSLTFTGTAGQRISLLTQSDVPLNGCGIVMQILQPDGTTKLYSDGCLTAAPRFSDVLILPVAGTYTIQYSPGGTAIGTATFTLINVPTDVSATITPGGGTVSLTTTVPGQNMSLTFNGTAGQRVSLLTQSDAPLNGCGIVMQILQPDGTTKLYSDTCLTVSPRFSDVLILPVAGTYTIQYNPSGTAIGTATFTLYNVPPDVTGTTTVGQAAANYATTVPGQAIQVSFAGTSGQSVTVAAGVVSATPSSPCYKITTLAPNGTTVRGDQSCSAIYSSGSLSLSQNGTSTVIVKPTGVAFGTFSVGVSTP
jgi:YD repeat-containing protein